jgi:Kef-type K+ transport system membrane component KefB
MSQPQWAALALQIAVMLACALALGHVFRLMKQPAVVGEILGGLLLGPTLLGRVWPEGHAALFGDPAVNNARASIMRTGMLAFILTIGFAVSISEFKRVLKPALGVGILGTFVPLGLGLAMVYGFPGVLKVPAGNELPMALFMASIMALSANPIIARILLDLGLFKHNVGRIIMSATFIDDLVGWALFAVLLAQFAPASKVQGAAPLEVLLWVGAFIFGALAFGRLVMTRVLDWAARAMPYPGGFIGWVLVYVLLCAWAAESLGIHSFLGAFLAGVALADHHEKHPTPYNAIGHFSLAYVTPVFFCSMALTTDFVRGFDLAMVLLVTAVAMAGKLLGVYAGGRLGGLDSRTSLAVGFGLNARGIIGIVMAVVAFEQQVIGASIMVACIVMCIVTTMLAGPLMQATLGRQRMKGEATEPAEPIGSAP